MQKYFFKISAFILIIILVSIGVYYYNRTNRELIIISTPQGEIKIDNIYKLEGVKALSLNGIAFKETDKYYLAYYPEDQGFIIAILNPNIEDSRKEAEKEFIKLLGINKTEACNLTVELSVPYSINKEVSGKNYGLSFCPDGIPFDQTVSEGQAENSSASQSDSLLQKLMNIFKNPLTVALGAAFVIVAGIILFARR